MPDSFTAGRLLSGFSCISFLSFYSIACAKLRTASPMASCISPERRDVDKGGFAVWLLPSRVTVPWLPCRQRLASCCKSIGFRV